MSSKNDRVVYSTELGRVCPECQKALGQCTCAAKKKTVVQGSGQIRVRRETKGRNGKTVSTISGVPLHQQGLEKLCSEMKRICGAGGSLKDGVIEIQGDHCDQILTELAKRGYAAKRAGG